MKTNFVKSVFIYFLIFASITTVMEVIIAKRAFDGKTFILDLVLAIVFAFVLPLKRPTKN